QVPPHLGQRVRLGSDRLDDDDLALRDAGLPVHVMAVDRVRGWPPVELEQRETLGPTAAPALGRIGERALLPPRTRAADHARTGAGQGFPERREEVERLRVLDQTDRSSPIVHAGEVAVLLRNAHLAGECAAAEAEASVDRLLGGPQRGERVAARVYVVEM